MSLQSPVRGGGAFTLSAFALVLASVGGVVSVGCHVLLQVCVAGPSEVDVVNKSCGGNWSVLESTNCERQSDTLSQAPDIH